MWFRKTIPFCQRTRTSPGCVAQQASGMGTLAIAFAARRTGELKGKTPVCTPSCAWYSLGKAKY